jgi:hypothetical protein
MGRQKSAIFFENLNNALFRSQLLLKSVQKRVAIMVKSIISVDPKGKWSTVDASG